jgi:hypothetical protein
MNIAMFRKQRPIEMIPWLLLRTVCIPYEYTTEAPERAYFSA